MISLEIELEPGVSKIFSDTQKTDPVCTVGTEQKTRVPLRRKPVTISSGTTTCNTNNMKKGNPRITGKGNDNSEEYAKVTIG